MLRLPPRPAALQREHGFTLVETLVAISLGVIVILATFSVLDISLSQSARIADRVDADQRSRLAMEKIMAELHSSCVVAKVQPVEPESTGTKIRFISQTGDEAYFKSVTLHEISLTGGNLVDTSYPSVGEEKEAEWTFSKVPSSTVTLLTGVTQTVAGEKTLPVFQYFKYEGSNLSTTPLSTSGSGLSTADADETAEVTVNFTTAPSGGNTAADRKVELSDAAVLRLDPASASGTNEPCR